MARLLTSEHYPRSSLAQQGMFAMFRLLQQVLSQAWPDCVYECCPLVITCTERHGHNEIEHAGDALCCYLQGKAFERLVVGHNFARFCLFFSHCLLSEAFPDCVSQCFPSIITWNDRHGHNENAGAGPQLLLARQGMRILSWMSCGKHDFAKHVPSILLSHCLHNEAWPDYVYWYCLLVINSTAWHVHNENAGAGPWSLLARWGMASLSWMSCCRTQCCHVPSISQFIALLHNAWLFGGS